MTAAGQWRTGPQHEENQAQYHQPQPDMATVQLSQHQAQILNVALHGDTPPSVFVRPLWFVYLQYSRREAPNQAPNQAPF